jgi:[ribosomal protein S5]-alanine N-acetyltransferase
VLNRAPIPRFPSLPLHSVRLVIRHLTDTDDQALFDIRSHLEVMRYWSSPPLAELEQAQAIITSSQEGYETGNFLQLGIERMSDCALIGTCTLFAFHHPSRRAEIGYALGRPFWGQGYMHEALSSFLQYAFDKLNLNRLEADIDPRNLASAETLARLGFVKEGFLRERWIVGDEVSDSDIYGLLYKDWRKI